MGSSPRVRSRPRPDRRRGCAPRIISACAEQTPVVGVPQSATRDHLRVCGADTDEFATAYLDGGSSPRVRSRPHRAGTHG